jgi:hypothetical protein
MLHFLLINYYSPNIFLKITLSHQLLNYYSFIFLNYNCGYLFYSFIIIFNDNFIIQTFELLIFHLTIYIIILIIIIIFICENILSMYLNELDKKKMKC